MIEAIDIARLRYVKDWPVMNLDTMPFVALEHRDLRKDLLSMGFSKAKVEKLPASSTAVTESDQRSKLVARERSFTDAPVSELDIIQWFECWVQVPTSGGATERRRLVVSNRELLDDSPATAVNIAIGAAFPQAHRVQGISLASKIIPVQVSKTEALRQFEDNLENNNLPRTKAYDVNMDDATNGRTNGIIRMESPNAIFEPMPVQDLTAGSLAVPGLYGSGAR